MWWLWSRRASESFIQKRCGLIQKIQRELDLEEMWLDPEEPVILLAMGCTFKLQDCMSICLMCSAFHSGHLQKISSSLLFACSLYPVRCSLHAHFFLLLSERCSIWLLAMDWRSALMSPIRTYLRSATGTCLLALCLCKLIGCRGWWRSLDFFLNVGWACDFIQVYYCVTQVRNACS